MTLNMEKQVCPDRSQWPALCSRGASDDAQVEQGVRDILNAVRTRGDEALLAFAERFDKVSLPQGLKVTPEEIREAQALVPAALQDAIRKAWDNIRRFHEAQRSAPVRVETAPGVVCWQKAVPIRRVGLYVPGWRFRPGWPAVRISCCARRPDRTDASIRPSSSRRRFVA